MTKKLSLAKVEQYEVPTPPAVYNLKVYLIALMGMSAALDYGYDLGFIGTTQTLGPYVNYFGLHNAAYATSFKSNVVTAFTAGAIPGAAFSGPLSGWLGRKPVNIFVAALFVVGTIVQATAGVGGTDRSTMMIVGRVINGISVGGSNTLAPYIVGEMSPPAIRGRLVGLYEIGVQMGTMLGFWVCYGLTRHHAANEMQWRIPFLLQLLFGGVYLVSACLVPESPRYLAKFGRDRAAASLAYIRNLPLGHPYLELEVNDIMAQREAEKELPGWRGVFKEINEKSMRRRIIAITGLFIFFEFSGTNSVNYYSPTIFAKLGITGQSSSFLATGVYGIIRFVAILVAMGYFVDKFGRKINLMVFGGLMAISLWIIGGIVKSGPTGGKGTACIVLIYVYAASFCFSFAGIPYIINTEIWPARLRPYGVSWGVMVHWIANLIVAKATPYIVASLDYGFFWLFAGFLTLSVPWTYFMIPETKGVPLERIEELFGGSIASVTHREIGSGHNGTDEPEPDYESKVEQQHRERTLEHQV